MSIEDRIQFKPFPKIPRLNRPTIITEKIDGTNACVVVDDMLGNPKKAIANKVEGPGIHLTRNHEPLAELGDGPFGFSRSFVYAQSRKRIISPEDDNFGFAAWVRANAQELADTLGPGHHYGEWFGAGIGRKYGLVNDDRRFALFNVQRWRDPANAWNLVSDRLADSISYGLTVVPVIATLKRFDTDVIKDILEHLRHHGSFMVPEFDRPEGIVIYHPQGNVGFKVTLEKDELSKQEAEKTGMAALL